MRFVILSSNKDLFITRIAIEYYSNFIDIKDLVVIAPSQSLVFTDNFFSELSGITLVRDEDIKDYSAIKEFLTSNFRMIYPTTRSTSWYLQQFIKLSYAHESPENIFISDGDTVFSKTLLGKISKNPFLLTTKENISQYKALCDSLQMPSCRISYIANGGFIDTKLIRQYIESPLSFFKHSMEIISLNRLADFSEYQIFGSINSTKYPSYPIKLFRRWDLLFTNKDRPDAKLEDALAKYDAISWETSHKTGFFRKVGARIFYFMNLGW